MTSLRNFLAVLLMGIFIVACNDDDDNPMPQLEEATFTVTIENIFAPKAFLASGTIGTNGLIMPGDTETYQWDAGKGTYLSLATMLVQTNDLFFGFADNGLALYDANGMPVTGDITSELLLWDAGTEVNEEPGTGPNQAPRQSGPDTGMDENGTVQVVNDGFTYPAVSSMIRATLAHDGETTFTLTIENISGSSALASPFAPGVWAIHSDGTPLFTDGMAAGEGLEDIAEDGNNAILMAELEDNTGYVSPLAPGVYAVHNFGTYPIFESGSNDRGEGLEALAEDGDPSTLATTLENDNAVTASGVFNTPVGAGNPGPLTPGNSYTFTFMAKEGDYLSLATMLVHTNDLFYAFGQEGIELFNNGQPITGDVTAQISLWDAGTEVNEYPGAGNNQPARGGGNSGPAENGAVQMVNDGFSYPAVNEAVSITIQAQK